MPGAQVLLVEDDEILCNIIRQNLHAREHQVRIAQDGQSALAHLRAHAFDLVVLDIDLPDQDGWDVLRVAQSEGYLHPQNEKGKLPVVVMSATHISSEELAQFHLLAYLPKPFPLQKLLRLVAEMQRKETKYLPPCKKEGQHV